jgi:hypothetical protein
MGRGFCGKDHVIPSMYTQSLRNAAHVRRFSIRVADTRGWEIKIEHDARILKHVVYTDWHRVERARATFAAEAEKLQDSGWIVT